MGDVVMTATQPRTGGIEVRSIDYVFTRSVDVAAETRVAQAEAAGLERAATEHQLPDG